MGYSRGIFDGIVIAFLSIGTSAVLMVSLDFLQIKLAPPAPWEEHRGYISTQRDLVVALKESMPAYAKTIVTDHNLSDNDRESLVALYLPIVSQFVASGDPKLIKKARITKMLIINNKITALQAE